MRTCLPISPLLILPAAHSSFILFYRKKEGNVFIHLPLSFRYGFSCGIVQITCNGTILVLELSMLRCRLQERREKDVEERRRIMCTLPPVKITSTSTNRTNFDLSLSRRLDRDIQGWHAIPIVCLCVCLLSAFAPQGSLFAFQ